MGTDSIEEQVALYRCLADGDAQFARELEGLEVLAEGVETERELQLMRTLGCDAVQGYLIARPMPLAQLLNWLAQRTPPG